MIFDYLSGKKFVTSGNEMDVIEISDITYVEYDKDIAKIHTINRDEPFYEYQSLKGIRDALFEFGFFQIDKHILVNIKYITKIKDVINRKSSIMLAGTELKISVSKQKEMKELFQSKKLQIKEKEKEKTGS